MKELSVLYQIEDKVEQYYIRLAQLEIEGDVNSQEYNYYLKLIIDLTNEEKKLLASLDSETIIKMRKKVNNDNFNKNNDKPIALGFLTNAYYFRIANMLDLQLGDDLFDYANTLRYDINQVLFTFLDYMINNEYYEDIREDLVFYKYNQIFLNPNSEYDFLILNDVNTVNLETKSYRTSDLPSYVFVDKAILVLESLDFNAYITNAQEDFRNMKNSYVSMVISIINVLSRLMLCEEDIINLVYSDVEYILDSTEVFDSIKEIFSEMYDILQINKNRISWAR